MPLVETLPPPPLLSRAHLGPTGTLKSKFSILEDLVYLCGTIIDALEDAGVEVPEGVLPPTRDLTEGQKLRKKELREEIARLKEREREHNEALRVKTEQWDTARKGLVDAVERHDSERAESFAPDYQLSKELDEQIKSAVAEIKGLV
ncbi:hypothetical protein BO85DRAFT_16104 [Aspergillus piperis CBS 112811]|uniref:Uncharacterized protein n=1 Tax=Aspergillus piperis CBS 112811 TaxID=1448313 RepID=A0A8G1RE77_9EURO|nr:hypothetical protein BO85DRAFT_16104 [Aspergillus piperis CBS 112811]RAH63044.1 hypothetical protein BO85DRAFT_16104 [Aspergillus piperis CBS 112811]